MTRFWRITTAADDLEEGLFGQVLLWVFEVLPALERLGVRAGWEVRSRLYGGPPQHAVLPGVFEPVDAAAAAAGVSGLAARHRTLLGVRVWHTHVLGGDWAALHALWHRWFRVPARIEAAADDVALPSRCLGLHYRGTDKNLALIDTNPVSADDFLVLARAFLAERAGDAAFDGVFLASDEPGMLARAREALAPLRVLGLGDIAFHKAPAAGPAKADRALLDCVLLSRCAAVLKCSSALSGFAKVLRPDLEIWRVAACKMFNDVPYFPDAYIPRLALRDTDPQVRAILARQFAGDWLDDARARARWGAPFAARPRYRGWALAVRAAKHAAARALGRTRKA